MTNYNFDSTFVAKSEFLSNTKFSGGLSLESSAKVREIYEKVCVYTTSSYSSLEIDVNQGSLHHYTAEAGSNFTVNLKKFKGRTSTNKHCCNFIIDHGFQCICYVKSINNWI